MTFFSFALELGRLMVPQLAVLIVLCALCDFAVGKLNAPRPLVLAVLWLFLLIETLNVGSRVTLWPDQMKIDTDYLDGPFRYLHSGWAFRDLPEGGCDVDFFVDFEFKNAILGKLIGVVFDEAMSRIVRAFETRARALYGA